MIGSFVVSDFGVAKLDEIQAVSRSRVPTPRIEPIAHAIQLCCRRILVGRFDTAL